MSRPTHLPDYTNPPLVEVVTGFQFEPIPGYSSVHSKDVWELFSEEFSSVEEHPLLAPKFETFGYGGGDSRNEIQLNFGPPQFGNRLWFVSKDHDHLIQFQPDRFLLNWRRYPENEYPRYESVASSFEQHVRKLDSHFKDMFHTGLAINQVEVTYINIIPLNEFSDIGTWIKGVGVPSGLVENISLGFNETILDSEGKPCARLSHEVESVFGRSGNQIDKAIRLSLTYRGAPSSSDIDASMRFAFAGREKIVTRFSELTTEYAHKEWGVK